MKLDGFGNTWGKNMKLTLHDNDSQLIITICWIITMMLLGTAPARSQTSATNSVGSESQALEPSNTNIWQNGIGQGFKPGTQSK